jgi:hypothetical protein
MKKLILPLMVSIVLFMFLDCKAETPFHSKDNSILLGGKPSIAVGAFCYNELLVLSWNSIGGAAEYRVSILSPQGGYWTVLATVPVKHGQKSYVYPDIDVSSWTAGSWTIMVEALNRKGDVKSSSQIPVTIFH